MTQAILANPRTDFVSATFIAPYLLTSQICRPQRHKEICRRGSSAEELESAGIKVFAFAFHLGDIVVRDSASKGATRAKRVNSM